MTPSKLMNKSQKGNALVIVLVVLAVVAVGALAYLSGQIKPATDAAAQNETLAEAPAESGDAVVDTSETADAVEGTETETAAEGESENPVVAMIGDEKVFRNDVLGFIGQLPPNVRQMPLEQLYPMALEQVINGRILDQNMETAGLENDPEVLKQLEEAKEQIIRNTYMQGEIEKKLTDSRMKKAYDDFIKEQPDVEEVKAAHILVADEAVAKDIIAKLKDGGDFAALAKEFSKDNTAENGGDLGYFAKSDVVPEFAEAAFALSKGKYTETPVKTQFGFHVIKQEDKRDRPKPTLEEAKPFLEAELRREILEEILEDWRQEKEIKRFDINGNEIEPASGEEEAPAKAAE
jgi:peptidyl-prolyl cis-trans isomerase C